MTLNFPLNPPLDDVFDPGNGIKYKWDGSQWSQLETTLKTIYPIDLDRDDGTAIVQRELTTFSGSKDFTYIFAKCTTPILSTELAPYTGSANPTQIQWKDYNTSSTGFGQGFVYINQAVHNSDWPNPTSNPPPYLYITDESGNVISQPLLGASNYSGYHWVYYMDPYVLDSLLGTDVSMSLCDPADPAVNDDEFDSGKNISSYPNFFNYFTFKDNTIGINDLVNSDELYATEKLTGLVDTFSIDNVTFNSANGTVRVDVTNTEQNTGYHAYDVGKVFNFSYNVRVPSGDEYTHFIDLTTITKI